LEHEQKHALFDRALQSIDHELRELIVLSRFGQMRYEQIATMMDCNLNTLKSRMCLAVNKLKQSYQFLAGEESS
jgi:RNA polymerase sigma-70 factor (ECF subfamily)